MKHIREYKIFENKNKNYPTILFSDVVGSSKLWSDDPVKMDKELSKHFDLVNDIANNYNGFVVKTIGDAFMIYFRPGNSLLNAIKLGIDILIKEKLNLRIGISYGEMEEKTMRIQDSNLKDYYGNVVNTASRLESKVSEEGGLAFSYDELSDDESVEIKKLIDEYKYSKIEFNSKCDKEERKQMRGKRSARLLSDIQINSCDDIDKLKGVKELTAFKVKIK